MSIRRDCVQGLCTVVPLLPAFHFTRKDTGALGGEAAIVDTKESVQSDSPGGSSDTHMPWIETLHSCLWKPAPHSRHSPDPSKQEAVCCTQIRTVPVCRSVSVRRGQKDPRAEIWA